MTSVAPSLHCDTRVYAPTVRMSERDLISSRAGLLAACVCEGWPVRMTSYSTAGSTPQRTTSPISNCHFANHSVLRLGVAGRPVLPRVAPTYSAVLAERRMA